MNNEQLVVQLLLQGALQMAKYAQTLNTARAQGRDVSDAELDAAASADDLARARLQAQIDKMP